MRITSILLIKSSEKSWSTANIKHPDWHFVGIAKLKHCKQKKFQCMTKNYFGKVNYK